MTLTNEFLLHPDIAKAASEAISNIERLRLAGYFRKAFELATALTSAGPWSCPAAGGNFQRAAHLLPMLALQCGEECPAVGEDPRRSPSELRSWAHGSQQDAFAFLLMADRIQKNPAGERWTKTWLEGLPYSLDDADEGRRQLGQFANDLLWVLKNRVRQRLNIEAPEMLPDIVLAHTPFRTSADISISPHTDQFDHTYLMDILERCLDKVGGDRAFDTKLCVTLAVVLDLANDNEEAAIARLSRRPSRIDSLSEIDAPIRLWEPYGRLLKRRALAPALGINDMVVAKYAAAFFSRSPARLERTAAAADYDWPARLADYSRKRAQALADPEAADNAAGMVQFHTPLSKILLDRAKRLEFTGPGNDEDQLAELESRLGTQLPPSYRNFLRATNGLFGGFPLLLPTEDVDWLRNIDPETIDGWNRDYGREATDEQYATYGADQDCVHMRPRHLKSALQVSTTLDGYVFLLIPDVRFGDEWEAWLLGYKLPGAIRYRSFAEMIEDEILSRAEREY